MTQHSDSSVPGEARARAEVFVGREWILDEISTWLEHGAERYLLLIGEPGWGKSALAAWLAGAGPPPEDARAAAKLASVRKGWGALHFCIARGQKGTVNPGLFTRRVAEQLAQRVGGFAPAAIERISPDLTVDVRAEENWGTIIGVNIGRLILSAPNAQDVFNRAIREPLQDLARVQPGLEVRVLVDALDEGVMEEGTTIVDLIAGAGDLPPGVRWVLTTRREPMVLDRFEGAKYINLDSELYAAAATEDVRAYIGRRLGNDGRQSGAAADLLQRSESNFLYARWILDEFVEQGAKPADIIGLPKGMHGLYRVFLDRLVPQDRRGFLEAWIGRYEPLFGCVAVATPAAPRASLSDWLGWTKVELLAHINQVAQVLETYSEGPAESEGLRFYHRSVADFLTSEQYLEGGERKDNRYYVDSLGAHCRIASHYLQFIRDEWAGDWTRSDTYGLRELVGHLRARLEFEPHSAWIDELYAVALDDQFHAAQRQRLGVHLTLADLRATMTTALARGGGADLLQAMRCVAAFREITRSEGLSHAVFTALETGEVELAFAKVTQYGVETMSRGWTEVLQLYLAWQAAEHGLLDRAREAVADATLLRSRSLDAVVDALLVRTAMALARYEREPLAWLAEFGRGDVAEALLRAHAPVAELDDELVQRIAAEVEPRIVRLERSTAEGQAEAASSRAFIEEDFMDPETSADLAWSLGDRLQRIASHKVGAQLISRAIAPILKNPYPRYRDIAMEALASAAMGSTDPVWVRRWMEALVGAGLDDEGVAFTFDVPAIVLDECRERGLPTHGLESYLETAANCADVWGTSMYALSADAAAAFRRGNVTAAFSGLAAATHVPTVYAGYGVMALLSLIDRCHEFGDPARAAEPTWGPGHTQSLFQLAEESASRVYDPGFREERVELVRRHREWAEAPPPAVAEAHEALSEIDDVDARRAYQSHVSARWSSAAELSSLVPTALFDSTALDTILGRLMAADRHVLSDEDVHAIAAVTAAKFTSGRPWTLGQWR